MTCYSSLPQTCADDHITVLGNVEVDHEIAAMAQDVGAASMPEATPTARHPRFKNGYVKKQRVQA